MCSVYAIGGTQEAASLSVTSSIHVGVMCSDSGQEMEKVCQSTGEREVTMKSKVLFLRLKLFSGGSQRSPRRQAYS